MTEHHSFQNAFLPSGEPVPGKNYREQGYAYKDLPRLTPEYFEKFIELVGEDNIVWLTFADYGDTKRGQILISPAGLDRISDYNSREDFNSY